MKKFLIYIVLSIYIFCTPQETLDKINDFHAKTKQEQAELNKIFDRDSLLLIWGYNEEPSQELIFFIDTFLQRTAIDLINVNGYISSMTTDYSQITNILEKAIIMERELDSDEVYFLKFFTESYSANYELFYKKRAEFAKKTQDVLAEEYSKYIALKNNIYPYDVFIGLPNNKNSYIIEKEQDFLTIKDSSITLLYDFNELPEGTYYMNYKLYGPDGSFKTRDYPMIHKMEKFDFLSWYWNFETIADLKNVKGKWKVEFVINNKVVNTSYFTLK